MAHNQNCFHILIIDDNRAIHDDFWKILSDRTSNGAIDEIEIHIYGKPDKSSHFPTYKIDSAFQGEEGIQLVKQSLVNDDPYAIIFIDMLMPPGKSGLDTIKEIWALDNNVQIVLCTAFTKISWKQIVEQLGENDNFLILEKPFDVVVLRQLANALAKKWLLNKELSSAFKQLLEADALKLDCISFDTHKLIDDTVNNFKQKLKYKPVTVESSINANVPSNLHGDPERLKQIINNILDNARKFTISGKIRVDVQCVNHIEDNHTLLFEITDNGSGNKVEIKKDIFSSSKQTNSGLGLAVCYKLIALMHGDIGVESAGDKGIKVWFTVVLKQ